MGSTQWKWKYTIILIFAGVGIIAASCSHTSVPGTTAGRTNSEGIPAIANPAALKCIEDGYQLSTVNENGVPTASFCCNPANGKKCEVWRYFRGECSLED